MALEPPSSAQPSATPAWQAWLKSLRIWMMAAARHRYAIWTLAFISWGEAIILPVPPDAMLVPMSIARPQQWWRLSLIATLCSVLGGLCSYCIGSFFFEWIEPWLISHPSYAQYFATVREWFNRWGVWALLIAGFTPLPFKLFTLTAGVMALPLLGFLVAASCGRGLRFAIVCAVSAHLRADSLHMLMSHWRRLLLLSSGLGVIGWLSWWWFGASG